MDENKNKYKQIRAAAQITQFGLSMISPVILCLIFALWLKNTFNIGNWVVIVAILLGVASSCMTMFNYIKTVKKEMGGKEHDEKRKD